MSFPRGPPTSLRVSVAGWENGPFKSLGGPQNEQGPVTLPWCHLILICRTAPPGPKAAVALSLGPLFLPLLRPRLPQISPSMASFALRLLSALYRIYFILKQHERHFHS